MKIGKKWTILTNNVIVVFGTKWSGQSAKFERWIV
jgi:hypothetical protein